MKIKFFFLKRRMDPSAAACIVYDSLKEAPVIPAEDLTKDLKVPEPFGLFTQWFEQNNPVQLTPRYEQISVQEAPQPLYCDPTRYGILQKVKDAFDAEGFIQARDAMNPFEKIGRSIFINRAAIKLANIDAVHQVTNELFTFDHKSSEKEFTFCDVAAGPGGFTQYMQYRFPIAKGYGMTLRHDKFNWSTNFIDMKRFTAFYGPDNTGNLYTNWEHFIHFVQSQSPDGVDLVTGDGGFDLEDGVDKTLLHRQEFISSRLLLTQSVIGVKCTKMGGNFVVKVFDTVTEFSAQVLYLLAQCFEKILIFKPVSSRPANAERYVICMNRGTDIQLYSQILVDAARTYTDTLYLNSLFQKPIPIEFQQWLTQNNTESIDRQLYAAQNILLYLQGSFHEIPQYDIEKFLIIWNLPDTPTHPKRTIIHI